MLLTSSSNIFNTDAISWHHIDVSFIIGDKIARKKVKSIFPDRGQPGFFKEIVQHWVEFDLVQIFHRYGLKLTFNESLCEWSNDLYCLVTVSRARMNQLKKTKIKLRDAFPHYSILP
jgi:hypothetical protein